LLPAGAIAGWDLHPLESAAFARRTPISDIASILRGLHRRNGVLTDRHLLLPRKRSGLTSGNVSGSPKFLRFGVLREPGGVPAMRWSVAKLSQEL
jgi:hypothetical protein